MSPRRVRADRTKSCLLIATTGYLQAAAYKNPNGVGGMSGCIHKKASCSSETCAVGGDKLPLVIISSWADGTLAQRPSQ